MANHWTRGTFFSFDIEATDANPLSCHFLSGSLVKFTNGVPSDKRSWLVKPGVQITEGAIEVHGITNEYAAQHGQDPVEALEEVLTMLAQVLNAGLPLVIYNAAYDLTVMELQARHYGLKGLLARVRPDRWSSVIDPFVMAQGYEAYRTPEGRWGKGYKLPEVCARYSVPFTETHEATADAVGAGFLAIALIDAYDLFAQAGPVQLTELQKAWRVRIQNELAAYFERKNKEHEVDLGWPLHSTVAPS